MAEMPDRHLHVTKTFWGIGGMIVAAIAIGGPTLYVRAAATEVVKEHATEQHVTTVDELNEQVLETAAVNGRVDLLELELGHIRDGVEDNSSKLDTILKKIEELPDG